MSNILNRRSDEWDLDKIASNIYKMFSAGVNVNGYKTINYEWLKKGERRKEDLKTDKYKTLKINISTPNNETLFYTIDVPILIDNHFFQIGGVKKIPIYQLIDRHIIHRAEEPDKIRLKTNITSAIYNKKDMMVTINNTPVYYPLLLVNTINKETFDGYLESLNLDNIDPAAQTHLENIITETDRLYKKYSNNSGHDMEEDLGEILLGSTKNPDPRKKAKQFLHSLKASYEIDIFNKEFISGPTLITEFIQAIVDGPLSVTDVNNKRIRFSEYILSGLIKYVYGLSVALFKKIGTKYNIPNNVIISSCSVSDIVRVHSAVNPIGEVAALYQATLVGPGGFKKENIPPDLRNMDDSQYGYICPADTPDRDSCGVLLNMVPDVSIDKLGKFEKFDDHANKDITSYPIKYVPFMENDDQTRLQMATSQMKQSIYIENSEKPIIRSGNEGLNIESTTFYNKAPKNGKVIFKNHRLLIVLYDDNTPEIYDLGYNNLYQSISDVMLTSLNIGDTFKIGDCITYSSYIQDGEVALGKNLLTGICIWKGYNYEDGIVISESVSKNGFTSPHMIDLSFTIDSGKILLSLDDDEYKPLPSVGETIKSGDAYAKLKIISTDIGLENINNQPNEYRAPRDCEIVSVTVYSNSWNKKIHEFNKFIGRMNSYQLEEYSSIKDALSPYISKQKITELVNDHGILTQEETSKKKFSRKGTYINGTYIEIKAIYKESIGVGDKIANRHGNKGVISRVVPDEEMPVTEDGRKLDIIINPLGILSRMNSGQLYELHLSEALQKGKENILEMIYQNEKIHNIYKYYEGILELSINDSEIKKKLFDEFKVTLETNPNNIDKIIYSIQKPFDSISPDNLNILMEYTGAKYKTAVYDPEYKVYLKNPISVGYIFFTKLIHRASEKISARSIGPYSQKTLQPMGGRTNKGGHRLGEMEVWALLGHGAHGMTKNLLTTHSDSIGLKNKLLSEMLDNPELSDSDYSDETPQSLVLLVSYLKSIGIDINQRK